MRQSAPRFPDGVTSRAVLIGCSDFDDIGLPAIPAVGANLADLRSALTDQTHGILPPEHCRVLADPADHRSVGMALAQAAREAEDLLLVYYTGHGLLDEDGLLHLALSSTDPNHVGFTGVPADLVKRYLGRARAHLRVLVLDCCFSGRAVAAMTESGSLLSAQLDMSGTYTLTSTTATAPSHAPPGQRHTAFTAALLDALNQPQPLPWTTSTSTSTPCCTGWDCRGRSGAPSTPPGTSPSSGAPSSRMQGRRPAMRERSASGSSRPIRRPIASATPSCGS
ncbi:caspase family protein [Streptomyces sp. NPDC047841]|uniref:caspase family protein n=1 Tax=Streptomyces sp. NPDC047841 TaxID=3154708 RepID=UPI003453E72A